MVTSERPMTLDEFLTLPEQEPALEFWDGVVRQKVSPQPQHARLQPKFAELLGQVAESGRLGLVFTEVRFKCGTGTAVPDISFYARDRIPLLPNRRIANGILGPPDLAVEIVSPDQSVVELVRKCLWYAANGVRVTLLLAPDDGSVFAFRPNAAPRVLHGSDRIDLDDVLPGFELTVADLFGLLVPPWARSDDEPAAEDEG